MQPIVQGMKDAEITMRVTLGRGIETDSVSRRRLADLFFELPIGGVLRAVAFFDLAFGD